jgi:hypothetical protein
VVNEEIGPVRVTICFRGKNAPNVAQPLVCQNLSIFFIVEKAILNIWANSVIKKQPKVTKRPIGENSPNLVSLAHMYLCIFEKRCHRIPR